MIRTLPVSAGCALGASPDGQTSEESELLTAIAYNCPFVDAAKMPGMDGAKSKAMGTDVPFEFVTVTFTTPVPVPICQGTWALIWSSDWPGTPGITASRG